VTVRVEQLNDTDAVSFVVEDSGRGIPESELAAIFSVFTPRDTPNGLAFSSAGMGLAICHKLVSAMGGTLSVESQVNRGTRFTFTLALPPG
jgi:signal transduction histidine kinase